MTIVRKLISVVCFHRVLNARLLKFQAANFFTDWVIALSPQDHYFYLPQKTYHWQFIWSRIFLKIGVSIKPMTHCLSDFNFTKKCLWELCIKGRWNLEKSTNSGCREERAITQSVKTLAAWNFRDIAVKTQWKHSTKISCLASVIEPEYQIKVLQWLCKFCCVSCCKGCTWSSGTSSLWSVRNGKR